MIEAVFAEAEPTCEGLPSPVRERPGAAETDRPDGADRDTRADRGTPDLSGDERPDKAGETVDSPAHDDPTRPRGGPNGTSSATEPVREAIGPGQRFRILRRYVRGGLGEVFVAFDEELRREVALKQIRPEHAGQARSQARFLLEAEITGGLEHPGIVPIYGLGRHADGRPYYAMRFVQGHTLKEAIAQFHGAEGPRRDPGERILALRQLLRRFFDICNALAYAHSRGVLHRDLKPANILLGPFGETLIVNWGLAKPMDGPDEAGSQSVSALRPSLAGDSTLTQTGSALGTPSFMSPEQAAGRLDRVGPPSDVYSLGATLYCVLTGRAPIEEPDIDEALRKAQSGDFPPPRQVQREVDATLEAICLRAMAREPEDRYPSPLALAEDLEHWLADEPVSARREPLSRRARRWARRHRTAVAATVVALVAGVVALGTVAGVQARANGRLRRANEETKAALQQSEESRHQAEAVSGYLVESFRRPDPGQDGRTLKVVDLLDQAVAKLDDKFAGSPKIRGELLNALGQTYLGLGLPAMAVETLTKARAVREAALSPDHPSTLVSRNDLAEAYVAAGRTAEAIELGEATRRMAEATLGPDHSLTLDCRNNLGLAYLAAGHTATAIALHKVTLNLSESKLGPESRETLRSRNNLAHAYLAAGRTAEAIALEEGTLRLRDSRLGPDHPETLTSRNNLAAAYRAAGRTTEAIALHIGTLKLMETKLGLDHPLTLTSRSNLAAAYFTAGRISDAIVLDEATFTLREGKLGPDHPETLTSRNNLAAAYSAAGRTAEAIALHEGTLKMRESNLGPDHPNTLTSRNNLAATYFTAGRISDAIVLHQATFKLREAKLGPDHPKTLNTRMNLANAYREAGRLSEAIALMEATLRLIESSLGPDHPDTLTCRNNLAIAYQSLGRSADAEALRHGTLARRRKAAKPDSPLLAGDLAVLGHDLLEQSRSSEAEQLLRECLAIREKSIPNDWRRFAAMSQLGGALLAQGRHDEAEPLIVQGYEGMEARASRIAVPARSLLREAAERVVRLYQDWNKPDQAAAWKAKVGMPDLPADVFVPAPGR